MTGPTVEPLPETFTRSGRIVSQYQRVDGTWSINLPTVWGAETLIGHSVNEAMRTFTFGDYVTLSLVGRPLNRPTIVAIEFGEEHCRLCEGPLGDDGGYRFTDDESISGLWRVCDACTTDLATCDDCSCFCAGTDTVTDSRGARFRYCSPCRSDNAYWCDTCDQLFTAEAMSGDGSTCNDCHRCECGECDCSDCYPNGCGCDVCMESDLIRSYSYKPLALFHSVSGVNWTPEPGVPYLGMELEVTIDDRSEGARIVTEAAPNLIYCKEDGSVAGFEMVTHPMTLDAARELIPFAALRQLRNDYKASGYPNGIHVHVSRSGFDSDVHAYRWMKLFYRNAAAVKRIARRDSQEWASFRDTERREHKYTAEVRKGKRSGKRGVYTRRYSAINVENRDTFEVRVFRGSLRHDEIMSCLELVDASVEYTRQLTTTAIMRAHGWAWPTFMTWCADQGERYRNLVALDEKTRPASEVYDEPVVVPVSVPVTRDVYEDDVYEDMPDCDCPHCLSTRTAV